MVGDEVIYQIALFYLRSWFGRMFWVEVRPYYQNLELVLDFRPDYEEEFGDIDFDTIPEA